ncbi:MAG: hypothetical protein EOO38_31685, partial [Cytophagaceae bacterium]
MEFEDVSEKMKWEAQRVAAAFGVKQWHHRQSGVFVGAICGIRLCCRIDSDDMTFTCIEIGPEKKACIVYWDCEDLFYEGGFWDILPASQYHSLMVRGLYRLGFE